MAHLDPGIVYDCDYDVDWMAIMVSPDMMFQMYPEHFPVKLCGSYKVVNDNDEYDDWVRLISEPFILSAPPREGLHELVCNAFHDNYKIVVMTADCPD